MRTAQQLLGAGAHPLAQLSPAASDCGAQKNKAVTFEYPACPCRKNALTAHLISPASGATFSMYLANLKADAEAAPAPSETVERWV